MVFVRDFKKEFYDVVQHQVCDREITSNSNTSSYTATAPSTSCGFVTLWPSSSTKLGKTIVLFRPIHAILHEYDCELFIRIRI